MKVLMVCLGNICRSPLAEGILQNKIEDLKLNWTVDSAGTSGWHNGEAPDSRSIEVAISHDIDISAQQSRKLVSSDFENFDILVAMDTSNFNDMRKMAKNESQMSKVKLLMNYQFPNENRVVPDPYYQGGFEVVYNMIDNAISAMITSLAQENSIV